MNATVYAERIAEMLNQNADADSPQSGEYAEVTSAHEQRSSLTNPEPWLVNYFNGGAPARAGVTVNSQTALSASSVFACVRNIAEDVAKLPVPVIEMIPGGGKVQLPAHPVSRILNSESNPEMNAFDARQAITACAVLFGNGYAEIERLNSGAPQNLWPLENWRVCPRRDQNKNLYYEIDGGRTRLAPADMLHVKGFGTNGVLGEMLVHRGRESIGLMIAAERFAASFFANGTHLSGVLEYPKVLTEEAIKTLRKQFTEKHAGPEAAHHPAVLENGMKWVKTSAEPDEAQMVETRMFQVEDVARWFRMPPHKIGHLERAQGWSTLESANADYVIDTLMPWFTRWEQEGKRKLLSPTEVTLRIVHLVTSLLRGDAASRGTYLEKLRNMGAINTNNVCEMEDLPPPPDDVGSVYLCQANMINVKKAAAMDGSPTDPTIIAANAGAAGGMRTLPNPPAADSAIIAAHRPALLDAAARVVRREVQVLAKNGTTPEAVTKFFSDHAGYTRDTFRPAIQAFEGTRAAIGATDQVRPRDIDIRIDFDPYIRELCSAIEAGTQSAVLSRWEREKPAELVNRFLNVEEVKHD